MTYEHTVNKQEVASLALCMYLHGHRILDQDGPQLTVELEEHLPLASLVEISQGQRLDVEGLPPFQLHLRQTGRGDDQETKVNGWIH